MLQRHTHVFHSHVIGHFLLAVVQLVSQNSDLLPAGIKGHAAGEHVAGRIHGLAREIRGGIPPGEIIAVIAGQSVFQSSLAHPVGGVGVTGIFGLIAGEDRFRIDDLHGFTFDYRIPVTGDIGCTASRTAKVHSDIHPPVGVQGDIAADFLRKVKGFALTVCIVIPACKGQAADIRIGRLQDGAAFLCIHTLVGAKLTVVVQEIHLVAAHAMKDNLYIVGRHGKCNLIFVKGILQSLGF